MCFAGGNVRIREVAVDVGDVPLLSGVDREPPLRTLPEGRLARAQVLELVLALALGSHRLPELAFARQPEPVDLSVVDGGEMPFEIVWTLRADLDNTVVVAKRRDDSTEVALVPDLATRRKTGSCREGK